MVTELLLEIDQAPGSLLRVLGLIERRGFAIEALELETQPTARRLRLRVQPKAGRCPENLKRQIDKLFGVRRAAAPQEPEAASWVM